MATISKTNTFSAAAVIVASEHNANFDVIYNDYNGNITNANCASNMALVDTKLAQITTASKVSTSAIADEALSITDLDLETAVFSEDTAPTTAANEGGVFCKNDGTQTELYFVEESDGDEVQITKSGNVGVGLAEYDAGSYAAAGNNLAATDGFVVANSTATTSLHVISGYTDSGATPSTLVAQNGQNSDGSDTGYSSICFPVKKGNYWRVDITVTTLASLYFVALGS